MNYEHNKERLKYWEADGSDVMRRCTRMRNWNLTRDVRVTLHTRLGSCWSWSGNLRHSLFKSNVTLLSNRPNFWHIKPKKWILQPKAAKCLRIQQSPIRNGIRFQNTHETSFRNRPQSSFFMELDTSGGIGDSKMWFGEVWYAWTFQEEFIGRLAAGLSDPIGLLSLNRQSVSQPKGTKTN